MKTALLPLFCTAAFGQNSYNPPRTLYGQPDLQGVWDFRTITPLERPKELGTIARPTDNFQRRSLPKSRLKRIFNDLRTFFDPTPHESFDQTGSYR